MVWRVHQQVARSSDTTMAPVLAPVEYFVADDEHCFRHAPAVTVGSIDLTEFGGEVLLDVIVDVDHLAVGVDFVAAVVVVVLQ